MMFSSPRTTWWVPVRSGHGNHNYKMALSSSITKTQICQDLHQSASFFLIPSCWLVDRCDGLGSWFISPCCLYEGMVCNCFHCSSAQALAALPDQDSFYDVTDCLEELGMEKTMQRHINVKGTDPDLKQQFTIYEVGSQSSTTRHSCVLKLVRNFIALIIQGLWALGSQCEFVYVLLCPAMQAGYSFGLTRDDSDFVCE